MKQIAPKVTPPLDKEFRPSVVAEKLFLDNARPYGVRAVVGLERSDGEFTRFETFVMPEGHPQFESNFGYVERIVKFLLWQRGGHTVYIGAPTPIGEYIREVYSEAGLRKFDYQFMGKKVYEKEFSIKICTSEEVPVACETGKNLGRNLAGCRIGFDLGASDRKVSAVVDGEPIYSEEVIWEPKKNTDPEYHYRELMTAIKTAASKMPRLDAIGGSSAGICRFVKHIRHMRQEKPKGNDNSKVSSAYC